MAKKSLIPAIVSKIPNFIKYGYPNAARLITDFYKWLETDNNYLDALINFNTNQEINREIEPYVDMILAELGWTTKNILIDKKLLVNTLRDFYLSRGTLNSFKYLYRILYNSDVDIKYQRDKIFTLSNSPFANDLWVLTSANSLNTNSFKDIYNNQTLNSIISGNTSKAKATINKIIPISLNGKFYFQILINDTRVKFKPNELVTIQHIGSSITEEIFSYPFIKISNPGVKYIPGDTIRLQGFSVKGVITVKSVISGGVDSISIIDGGSGYSIGDTIKTSPSVKGHSFFATVSRVSLSGSIEQIKIWNPGYEYELIPTLIIKGKGIGANLKANSLTIGGIKELVVSDQYWNKRTNISYTIDSVAGNSATFDIKTNDCIFSSNLAHLDENQFLGYGCNIFDGDKYQYYSYEIHSSVGTEAINTVINDLVHPIGYKKFNVFIHEDKLTVTNISSSMYSSSIQVMNLPVIQWNSLSGFQEMNSLFIDTLDSLSFNINNIDIIKFDPLFNHTVEEYKDFTLLDMLLPIKNSDTADPELTYITI